MVRCDVNMEENDSCYVVKKHPIYLFLDMVRANIGCSPLEMVEFQLVNTNTFNLEHFTLWLVTRWMRQ